MKSALTEKLIPLISIVVGSLVFSAILSFSTIGKQVDLLIQNTVYTTKNQATDVVIVSIDSKSTEKTGVGLGNFATWSKNYWATAIENISNDGAKVIGIDILFKAETNFLPLEVVNELKLKKIKGEDKSELLDKFLEKYSGTLTPEVQNFKNSLKENSGKIVLPIVFGENEVEYPLNIYSEEISNFGFIDVSTDEIGQIRYITPSFEDYLDFGVKIYELYAENKYESTQKSGKMFINFYHKPFEFPNISFVDLVQGRFEKGSFDGKVVLIGLTNPALTEDKFFTPVSKGTLMPGVEFRANEVQTLISNEELKQLAPEYNYLFCLLTGLLLTILFLKFSSGISTLIILAFIILYYLSARIFFEKLIILPFTPILFIAFFSYVFSFAYRYFISDKQGRELKNSFSKYVSADLVEQIVKNPEMVKLGGEKRVVTVFFMDIKDSTSISEKVEIGKWVAQLNEYFTMMESIVKARGGTVDKFEGDAIMGFFGAPFEQKDQVLKAFLCALDMKEILVKLHEKWAKEGLPLIEFRIGINTGEAIVGNIGSVNRFDYTAMGDTVNTASRMEGSVNKTYKTQIIAANFENNTDLEMLKKYIVLREIDSAIMLGKTLPTRLYEIVCKSNELTQNLQNILSVYSQALNEYRQKNFEKAKNLFASISQVDEPSKVMEERTTRLLENPNRDFVDEQMNFKLDRK